uniref:Transcription initiation factor TFIID subunit 1 histone acetyltransferase domain-containing protein n=1 Tax=Chromera velia CCMP2878 TaxID=1169474 RepID=A0A0G4F5E3_9ALVE|eukprot:Cvel_15305.t1-p1 / transcript=Cvel_15305.t1 / gene=Cvel_15305 / organism=Chromera_velia_CCMP2878 / gene_product=hypothetical protein / transcript_product=hypothetical protein / location=Cvel_scaffold1124:238-3130(-) / protein_length=266 / sequence_SO=supercontig / SO=protein_coding / is_pseudo=false
MTQSFSRGVLGKESSVLLNNASLDKIIKKAQAVVKGAEDWKTICTPEQMCAFDAMLKGLVFLKCRGVTQNVHPAKAIQGQILLQHLLQRSEQRQELLEAEKRRAASGVQDSNDSRELLLDQRLFQEAGGKTEISKKTTSIAKLIEDLLTLSPWHITLQYDLVVRQNGGNFVIEGVGDPSLGRGEGISFIRLEDRQTAAGLKKGDTWTLQLQQGGKGGGGRGGKKSKASDDLRKLHRPFMERALIRDFGHTKESLRVGQSVGEWQGG